MADIDLDISRTAPEALHESWMGLEDLREEALEFIKEQGERGNGVSDPDAKSAFAHRMDELNENFHVLDAWAELMHGLWVLSTHGSQTLFFLGTQFEGVFNERVTAAGDS